MSQKKNRIAAGSRSSVALAFAALGDETRLGLVAKLSDGQPHSITQLSRHARFTRQAITKHLRVLERAGMVHTGRRGRESLFQLDPASILDLKDYLEIVSEQWHEALVRLKSLVEN